MSRLSTILVATALALVMGSRSSWADTVYVIDTLAVGVHEDKRLDSPIIKVVPTGTPLEVLSTEGELVEVKTEEGVVGWVDATYLMEGKPAQLALLELEASYSEAQNQLKAARDELAILSERVVQLESAKKDQSSTNEVTSETLRDIERLTEENQALKDQLQSAHATRASASNSTLPMNDDGNPATRGSDDYIDLTAWHWIMVGALMLLAFGLGGFLVDLGVRRRHGGFRV